MSDQEEGRVPGLEALRAPPRSGAQRARTRDAILRRAAPLLGSRRPASSWEVLADWARPGLAAAAAVAAVLIWLPMGRVGVPEATRPGLDEVLEPGGEAGIPEVLVSANEPNLDAVLAAALGRNRSAVPTLRDPSAGREP